MTVSNSWRDAYQNLESFTAIHPAIKIDESRVTLPDEVRGEFYQLFDTVREMFVKDYGFGSRDKAANFVENYALAKSQVAGIIYPQGVPMPGSLELFLASPEQALANALFDELFELLQKKVDESTFEQVAIRKLDLTISEMCRLGYPYWVMLALASLFEPDEAFRVGLDSGTKPVLLPISPNPAGNAILHPTLRLPELIIHSPRINKYIALKLELSSEIGTYTTDNRAERKKAIRNRGKTDSVMSARALLIYVLTRPEEIPIVADLNTRRVSPPDVIVECLDQSFGAWDIAQLHHDILHPKQGTFVLSMEPALPANLPPPGKNICPLAVGFDSRQLLSIVKALSRPEVVSLPV